MVTRSRPQVDIRIVRCDEDVLGARLPRWATYVERKAATSLSRHPGWLAVLRRGLKHEPYCVEAVAGSETLGLLPLALVRSLLFGRFLVGLPYLNTGGVLADDEGIARRLIDRAVELADSLDVRYLELRHEKPIAHPALGHSLTSKVHMRLALPDSSERLWKGFESKIRNHVRKGEKVGLAIAWGGAELLDEFYDVFARNMRDLGTPVFSRRLFESILAQFPDRAELCVARYQGLAVAAGLVLHGPTVTELPSASSLRTYSFTNANSLMHWHLLQRAIKRGQRVFDFGRSSLQSGTFVFKRQWGAEPEPAVWQYYVRKGAAGEMRPDNSKYQRLISLWQRLPVRLTRWIGPAIVRGIP